MKTKLVTSYYPFHNGEPYWGTLNRDKWYKYSLATISNMGEIICYTDPGDKGYNQLSELKEKLNLENLTIKIYDIKDNPYQSRVYKIRTEKAERYNSPESYGYYTRPTAIYWMKFIFLAMEYEPNTQLYWIDAGLSHNGLFPSHANKYGTEPEFSTYYGDNYAANEYKVYNYDKGFTPEVLNKINEYAEDKIINLCRSTSDDNPSEFNTLFNIDVEYNNMFPVGGFFGGQSDLLLQYVIKCKETIDQILLTNEICTEQAIMAYVNATNRDWFKNWHFSTFYHEEWGPEIFKEGMISFYNFFYKKSF